ncbi:hypothetical protein [Nocardia iowensis]|uniref:Tetratricopeptide repeat protein n=1 Tax=Nocardia iowensis TaxID=204891 RepID=A0ABX8RGT3_NOCIO|nr:hypothetical protein [Nocardia iowensis]QXN88783.1 hypothetical protein KV110_24715 [Nocardia iowensis]
MAGRFAIAIVVSCVALVFVGAQAPVANDADDVAPLYNAAQDNFVRGDVAGGLALLEQAVAVDPGNTDVLALRAFWADEAGDVRARDDSVNRLCELAPTVRTAVLDALRAIHKALVTRVNFTPTPQGPETAIVIPGYGLLPDGSMRPELINRLQAGHYGPSRRDDLRCCPWAIESCRPARTTAPRSSDLLRPVSCQPTAYEPADESKRISFRAGGASAFTRSTCRRSE